MVLTDEEWEQLHKLLDSELEVWSQLRQWTENRCNTYDTYYKGDKQ